MLLGHKICEQRSGTFRAWLVCRTPILTQIDPGFWCLSSRSRLSKSPFQQFSPGPVARARDFDNYPLASLEGDTEISEGFKKRSTCGKSSQKVHSEVCCLLVIDHISWRVFYLDRRSYITVRLFRASDFYVLTFQGIAHSRVTCVKPINYSSSSIS